MKEENLQNNVEINYDDNLYQYEVEPCEFDYYTLRNNVYQKETLT